MSTQEPGHITEFRKQLEDLRSRAKEIGVGGVARADLATLYVFNDAPVCFAQILAQLERLLEPSLDLAAIPSALASATVAELNQFVSNASGIKTFKAESMSTRPTVELSRHLQSMDQNLTTRSLTTSVNVSSCLALSSANPARFLEDIRSQATQALNSILEEAKKSQAEAQKSQAEAHLAAEAAKKAAAGSGVAHQAEHFSKLQGSHEIWARVWLGISIFLIVVLCGFAISIPTGEFFGIKVALGTILKPDDKLSPYFVERIVRSVSSRLLWISLLAFGLSHSVRNYRAHRHNQITNKHREVALMTFEAFVAGAATPETKDAVLVQATQAIFAPPQSGFGGETPDLQPQNGLEVARRLAGGKDAA